MQSLYEDPELVKFTSGKSDVTLSLLSHFLNACSQQAAVSVSPAKTMISVGTGKGKVWITQLGRNFVHIVFPFKEQYPDNLCFQKIAQVPGQNQYNHHFRMYSKEDLNEEVLSYLRKALVR